MRDISKKVNMIFMRQEEAPFEKRQWFFDLAVALYRN